MAVDLNQRLAEALEHLEDAHAMYLQMARFGGPSLHFHLRALETARGNDFELFAEMVYALLASWGMHRMGSKGAKMIDFEPFLASLLSVRDAALSLRDKTPDALTDDDWEKLRTLFKGIRCMESEASIVGNSKVLAHWLPELVPPIDRTYTLTLLKGHMNIANGIERECKLFETLLRGFFYPLVNNDHFRQCAERWMAADNRTPWDSSYMKITDNIVIGLVALRNR